MNSDLLFHITNKEQWREYSSSGFIEPESLELEGFIHTSEGKQVQDTLNRIFKGEKDILLLVIDPLRIQEPIKYEKAENGEVYPHIYGKVSLDAIIDKIPIQADKRGEFNIKVKHFD